MRRMRKDLYSSYQGGTGGADFAMAAYFKLDDSVGNKAWDYTTSADIAFPT